MSPGDLVLIPHGGERIGRVLARVESAGPYTAIVRPWSPHRRAWGAERLLQLDAIKPAPDTDRRVRAARKAIP